MSSERSLATALPYEQLADEQVRRIWTDLTGIDPVGDPDAWEACEDAILGALEPERGLRMRPGGWTVDLRVTAVRTAVAAALIAGSMWPAGLDQLPAFVLPQVLPLLFDVRRARLSRQDERLLLHLRMSMNAEQMEWPWVPEALYQRLPDELRSTVSPDDFHDFVRRLVQVGEADDAGFDEARLRPAGRPAWLRITVG
jgi:hypothetical protein